MDRQNVLTMVTRTYSPSTQGVEAAGTANAELAWTAKTNSINRLQLGSVGLREDLNSFVHFYTSLRIIDKTVTVKMCGVVLSL